MSGDESVHRLGAFVATAFPRTVQLGAKLSSQGWWSSRER